MTTQTTHTTMREPLLAEFDEEMAHTRKSLERVPEDRLGWKPHPKSGTLGWLASFLAVLPSWTVTTLKQDSFDLAPPGKPPERLPTMKSRSEIVELFDRNVAEARAAIAAASDEDFHQPWTLLASGKKLMTMPRAKVLRSMMLSHMIHHRAQLGVYLRLLDVPVPAIYGPSADENPWGAPTSAS
jgi:uncharacterized damage-inducible protein DinB